MLCRIHHYIGIFKFTHKKNNTNEMKKKKKTKTKVLKKNKNHSAFTLHINARKLSERERNETFESVC